MVSSILSVSDRFEKLVELESVVSIYLSPAENSVDLTWENQEPILLQAYRKG